MSEPVIVRRSQAILRLPVDEVAATMVLHDGARSEIVLFVPAGETVLEMLTGGDAFFPVVRNRNVCFVARAAIACLSVPDPAPPAEPETALPVERQRAVVHLKCGVAIEGELRWLGPAARQRTVDHLNDLAPSLQVHGDGLVHHVVKAHVALVEER